MEGRDFAGGSTPLEVGGVLFALATLMRVWVVSAVTLLLREKALAPVSFFTLCDHSCLFAGPTCWSTFARPCQQQVHTNTKHCFGYLASYLALVVLNLHNSL